MMQPITSLPTPLSQPPKQRHDVRGQMHALRAALAEGWEIVQPIFARPLWSALDDGQTALHCVLQRDRSTQLLTLPETPAVRRFVRQRSWQVQGR